MQINQDTGQPEAFWFKGSEPGDWSLRDETKDEKVAEQVWRRVLQRELQIARQELAKIRRADGQENHARYVQRWIEESSALLKKVAGHTPKD